MLKSVQKSPSKTGETFSKVNPNNLKPRGDKEVGRASFRSFSSAHGSKKNTSYCQIIVFKYISDYVNRNRNCNHL